MTYRAVAPDCEGPHSDGRLSELEPATSTIVTRGVVGSKGAAGAWQRIVSMLPAHRVFVEAFAGGAAVTRRKRSAESTILVERDPETAAALRAAMSDRTDVTVIEGDALAVLPIDSYDADVCVYCDPPYVMGARRTPRRYYRFDWSDADHERFLAWVRAARCPVLVSGYWSDLYAVRLDGWRSISFGVATRGGRAIEHVWCNFPEPRTFHDPRHVGRSFTDRQRIKRKAQRWARMLAAMPADERAAVMEAIGIAARDAAAAQPSTARADLTQSPPAMAAAEIAGGSR